MACLSEGHGFAGVFYNPGIEAEESTLKAAPEPCMKSFLSHFWDTRRGSYRFVPALMTLGAILLS